MPTPMSLPSTINNVEDLRTVVGVLTTTQNTVANQTTPQPTGAAGVSAPASTPVGVENQLSAMSNTIQQQIGNKLRFIDKPPLFKKPAYFLDRLIPYFRMYVWIIMSSQNDPRATDEEKRNNTFKAYKFTILTDEEVDINNHLVSFKYTVVSASEPNVEITVVDIKQEIMDVLTLQFAKQGIVSLDVEFGWKVEPNISTSKELQNIFFSNTINVALSEVKSSFNNLGIPQFTFLGIADIVLPGELRYQTPYAMFGRYPAMALVLKEILAGFQDKIETWAALSDRPVNMDHVLYYMFSEFLKTKYILDPVSIMSIIQKLCDYYKHDLQDTTASSKPKDNPFSVRLQDRPGDLQKTKFLRAINSFGGTVTSTAATRLQQASDIAGRAAFSGSAHTTPGSSPQTIVLPGGATQTIQATAPIHHHTPALFDESTSNDLLRSNYLIDLVQNIEELDDATINKKMNNQTQYNLEIRSKLLEERTKTQSLQFFSNAYIALISVLLEVGRIHPYYLYRYSMNILHKKVNAATAMKMAIVEVPLLRIDYKTGDVNIQGSDPTKNIYPLRENVANKFFDQDYEFEMTQEESQQYGKLLSEIVCDPNAGWSGYLNSVVNSIKIRVNQRMTLEQARMYGIEQSQLTRVTPEGTPARYTLPPLSLSCNFFTTTKERMQENLRIFQLILQQRLDFMKQQNAQHADNMLQQSIASMERALKKIKDASSSQKKWFMFISTDILATDTIFSAEAGLTQLIQAYSFRVNGLTDNKFNPGHPTAAHVNFPDVISFSPELDYWQMQLSLISNARTDTSTNINGQDIVDERQQRANILLEEAKTIYNTGPTSTVLKGSVTAQNLAAFTQALSPLQDKLTEIDNLGAFPMSSQYSQDEPITFMIAQNYQSNRLYTNSLPGVLDRKKTMQELRRRMLMSAKSLKGQLVVVGDPSFGISQSSKYIFFKMINQDNSLSYFTGIYVINNITHELTAGKYTTTLDLMYASQLNEANDMQQLYDLSYQTDPQSVRIE